MSLLCCLGIHKWEQSRPRTTSDIFPCPGEPYDPPIRVCTRCGRVQSWLPGYGGSELGCWRDVGYETPRWKVLLALAFAAAVFVAVCVAPFFVFKPTNPPPQPVQVEKP
jgi:hypothetical protein